MRKWSVPNNSTVRASAKNTVRPRPKQGCWPLVWVLFPVP